MTYSEEERNRIDTIRLIANHYYWCEKRNHQSRYSHEDFGKEIGTTAPIVGNFLSAQANTGWEIIQKYLQSRVMNKKYAAPDCIKSAIRQVYDHRAPAPYFGIIQEVFEKIADASRAAKKNVGECYNGTWNVLRYASHDISSGFEATLLNSGRYDALVVRVALVIDNPEKNDFPAFKIHYRLGMAKKRAPIKYASGCVIPHRNGPHLLFFGAEEDNGYPLSITTHRHLTPPTEFWGIVKRRVDTNQRYMSSRVAFFRTDKPIADLESLLGLHRESEILADWSDDFPDLERTLAQLENKIDYQGKSGLWL